MTAGAQVRLKEKPEQEMVLRNIAETTAVCDYVVDNTVQDWTGPTDALEEITVEDLFPVKINPISAGAEVKKWLDFKRVKPIRRNQCAEHISTIIQAVMYGDIVIAADFTITHNLNVPLLDTEGKTFAAKLVYAPRITAQTLSDALSKVTNNSEIDNTIAYGSALADMPVAIVRKLDTSDLSVLSALSVFFV